MFDLHPRLKGDTFAICSLAQCDALLMNNSLFPWVILVPRVAGAEEIMDLPSGMRVALMEDIVHVSCALRQLYAPDKINVAALGNQVRQLHVHVVARFAGDAAWPEPVWGRGSIPYADATPTLDALRQALLA